MRSLLDTLYRDYDFLSDVLHMLRGVDNRKLVTRENALLSLQCVDMVRADFEPYESEVVNIVQTIYLVLVSKEAFLSLPGGYVQDSIKDILVQSMREVQVEIAKTIYLNHIDEEIDVFDDMIPVLKNIYSDAVYNS